MNTASAETGQSSSSGSPEPPTMFRKSARNLVTKPGSVGRSAGMMAAHCYQWEWQSWLDVRCLIRFVRNRKHKTQIRLTLNHLHSCTHTSFDPGSQLTTEQVTHGHNSRQPTAQVTHGHNSRQPTAQVTHGHNSNASS
jgi:hypothetical protein